MWILESKEGSMRLVFDKTVEQFVLFVGEWTIGRGKGSYTE